MGLEEGDISRTDIPLSIIEEDSEVSLGKGLDQTNMAITVLAETERDDFHDDS
jgi:hypothetical protein